MSAEERHVGIDEGSSPRRIPAPSSVSRHGSLPLLATLVCAALLPFLLSGLYLVAGLVILAAVATVIVVWSRRTEVKTPNSCATDQVSSASGSDRVLEPDDIFRLDAAIERCGGTEDCLLELITVSRTEFPKLLAAAREANEGNDAQSLARTAHTLKGSAMIFAAEPARLACQQVEILAKEGQHTGAEMAAAMDLMSLRINELLVALETHAARADHPGSPP